MPFYNQVIFILPSQLFGHENVSVLDGGLKRWIGDGFETTDAVVQKGVIKFCLILETDCLFLT